MSSFLLLMDKFLFPELEPHLQTGREQPSIKYRLCQLQLTGQDPCLFYNFILYYKFCKMFLLYLFLVFLFV